MAEILPIRRKTISNQSIHYGIQVQQSISNVTGAGSVNGGVDGGTTSRHESIKGMV